MSEFKVRDRVQDVIWDGQYVGTVKRVDADGDLYIRWDGHWAEYQVAPHQVTRIDEREVA